MKPTLIAAFSSLLILTACDRSQMDWSEPYTAAEHLWLSIGAAAMVLAKGSLSEADKEALD